MLLLCHLTPSVGFVRDKEKHNIIIQHYKVNVNIKIKLNKIITKQYKELKKFFNENFVKKWIVWDLITPFVY